MCSLHHLAALQQHDCLTSGHSQALNTIMLALTRSMCTHNQYTKLLKFSYMVPYIEVESYPGMMQPLSMTHYAKPQSENTSTAAPGLQRLHHQIGVHHQKVVHHQTVVHHQIVNTKSATCRHSGNAPTLLLGMMPSRELCRRSLSKLAALCCSWASTSCSAASSCARIASSDPCMMSSSWPATPSCKGQH